MRDKTLGSLGINPCRMPQNSLNGLGQSIHFQLRIGG